MVWIKMPRTLTNFLIDPDLLDALALHPPERSMTIGEQIRRGNQLLAGHEGHREGGTQAGGNPPGALNRPTAQTCRSVCRLGLTRGVQHEFAEALHRR